MNKNDELDNLLDVFEYDENEKKTYYKTLINFPETGQAINAHYIQSIEKVFRLKESISNFEAEPIPEYGISINTGMTSGMNLPKADIEFWYKDETYRDQRYNEMIKKLDEIGIKVITV